MFSPHIFQMPHNFRQSGMFLVFYSRSVYFILRIIHDVPHKIILNIPELFIGLARPKVPGQIAATEIGEELAKQSKGLFSASDWQCATFVGPLSFLLLLLLLLLLFLSL
jgi:hypothetical protein